MKRLIILILTVYGTIVSNTLSTPSVNNDDLYERYKTQLQSHEWDLFLKALILVESEGNPNVVGKSNDVGILQITPIYVKEVNRISNSNYTLEDRYSIKKSLEMFNIMQNHYNPNHDINRAIKLHNPKAGSWYKDKIMVKMNQLKSGYYV